MTETTIHRPQLRFPGQAAAPDGPADMTIMYLMHHAFRRDLRDFTDAVPRTPVDDRAAWQALARRWEHLSVPLHIHHHEEDTLLWPFLLERADEEHRATLEAMEAEHAEIDPALTACAEGFARMAEHPDHDTRAALAVRLAAVRESLGRHLHHEETETIALLQRVMTGEEWAQMEKRFSEGVTFSVVLQAIPWTMHKVPADLREEVLQRSPAAQRVIWWLTRRRFARLDRKAFAYLL